MMKILTICFLAISSGIAAAQTNPDIMASEATRFIESMPADLQEKQNEAIKAAMTGNSTALNEVRMSRNKTPDLPPEVDIADLSERYRLFTPAESGDTKRPLLIYLHGGGWCFGSINSCSTFCAELVTESGAAVLAVDYPLAPEHPYPAPLNACVDAVVYAKTHADELGIDPDRISIGGDSAGGNLALATTLKLISGREEGSTADSPSIRSLVLFYPVVKAWNDGSDSWESYQKGYGLDGEIMETFNMAYANETDPRHPLISPFNAEPELLAQLPPILLINAERDILRDQGIEFYSKLKETGVDIQQTVLPGSTHLFITVPGQHAAFRSAVALSSEFLKKQ